LTASRCYHRPIAFLGSRSAGTLLDCPPQIPIKLGGPLEIASSKTGRKALHRSSRKWLRWILKELAQWLGGAAGRPSRNFDLQSLSVLAECCSRPRSLRVEGNRNPQF
jgi:hypothetical protein